MSNEFTAHIEEMIEAGFVKEAAEECLESAEIPFSNDLQFLRTIIYTLATEIARGAPTRPRPASGGRFEGQRRVSHTVYDSETGAEFPHVRHVSQVEFERLVCADAEARIRAGARVGDALRQTGEMYKVDAGTVKKYRSKKKR